MCEPSIVCEDWITKGCHIHIDGIELAVFPDHRGSLGFRPVFSSTTAKQEKPVMKKAFEVCLTDPEIRKKWIDRLEKAQLSMLDHRGELFSLARGRMAEFKFLRIALERWGR